MASAVKIVAKHMKGVICQRAILLHLGAAFLLLFPYWFSGPLLKAIGQSETISEQGELCRAQIDHSAICICHKLSNADVLTGTEHCQTFGLFCSLCVQCACFDHLACGSELSSREILVVAVGHRARYLRCV